MHAYWARSSLLSKRGAEPIAKQPLGKLEDNPLGVPAEARLPLTKRVHTSTLVGINCPWTTDPQGVGQMAVDIAQ